VKLGLIALNKLKLSEKVLAFYGKKQIKESNLNKIIILREITY